MAIFVRKRIRVQNQDSDYNTLGISGCFLTNLYGFREHGNRAAQNIVCHKIKNRDFTNYIIFENESAV